MKFLIITLIMFGSSLGVAETIQLPEATINREVLGGDILLIKMKDYLIISGKEGQDLEKELGVNTKKKFTRDIVMTKSFDDLVAIYNPSNDRRTVQTVLNRYSDVLAKINSKPRLN